MIVPFQRLADPCCGCTLISAAYAALSRDAHYEVTFLPLGTDANTLAKSARRAAKDGRWPGQFPPLPERDEIQKAYQEWLAEVEQQA